MHTISEENQEDVITQTRNGMIETDNQFFSVSTAKLVVMSLATLNLYQCYWYYKNWLAIKNTGHSCWPLVRGIFYIWTSYFFFGHLLNSAKKKGVQTKIDPLTLALSTFILNALWRLPAPYDFISILAFLPTLPANNLAILINKAQSSNYVNNNRFTLWNWLIIILAGLFWTLFLIGSIFPEA